MSGFRHDPSGRSTSRRKNKRESAVNKPRGPFIYYEADLLRSPAWQALSINGRRVVERIQLEHLRHAGRDNGYLPVTFNDFVAAGVSRKYVSPSIIEAEALGLIERTSRGRKKYGDNPGAPSTFRITFLGGYSETDIWPASDEWRRFDSVKNAKAAVAEAVRAAEAAALARRAELNVERSPMLEKAAGGS
jgi:hypothetical protein